MGLLDRFRGGTQADPEDDTGTLQVQEQDPEDLELTDEQKAAAEAEAAKVRAEEEEEARVNRVADAVLARQQEAAKQAEAAKEKKPEPTGEPTLDQMKARVKELRKKSIDDLDGDAAVEADELNRQIWTKEHQDATKGERSFVASLAADNAFQKAVVGLSADEQAAAAEFIQAEGIDPSTLAHPTIAKMVRSTARELYAEKSGKSSQKPIPKTESAAQFGNLNIDAETRKELQSMKSLYESLGLKFNPAKLLGEN